MDTTQLLLIVLTAFVAGLIVIVLTKSLKKNKPMASTVDSQTRLMQLQAYERLSVFVERIAIPNLIARESMSGITAREMQMLLTQNIRQEFDYNISQQIYVSPTAWSAVKNLKEQNLLIINQTANTLPPNATGLDLNKQLIDYLLKNKEGALHEIVSNVVNHEAKKVM